MRKLTIALLVINFLMGAGCAQKPGIIAGPEMAVVRNNYFSDTSKDYVYRTKIFVYGNELNGILIAKKISDATHRVVLTTDFGNTLFDFEIGKDVFKINNIVADLDRKIIVNTLRDDFRLVLREQYATTDGALDNNGKLTQESRNEGNLLRFSSSDNRLTTISSGTSRKQKVIIGFESENNIFADKITIRHYDIKLQIEMIHF